jgi:hypothetical protein
MKLTRSYDLKLFGNTGKIESAKYSSHWFRFFTQHFVNKLYFNKHVKQYSTKGWGTLVNQAQKKAFGVIRAESATTKATGNKSSPPILHQKICPAVIQPSKDSSFDYWVMFHGVDKRVSLPTKSIKKLNRSFKDGWILSQHCEIFDRKGYLYVRVFVSKEVEKATETKELLGCDVGINKSVTRSDKYKGKSLKETIKKNKKSQAERQRQKHKSKKIKSEIKQILDLEALRAVRRSKALNVGLAVENPKVLANLRIGRLVRWARCYFARRCETLCKEESVWVKFVNPAYTSITCLSCRTTDRQSRESERFVCKHCNFVADADYVGAVNISLKGSGDWTWVVPEKAETCEKSIKTAGSVSPKNQFNESNQHLAA